jgi:superfamily II DNA or RNA helicase
MARLSLADIRVRQLVTRLVPVTVELGSINRACDVLNEALAKEGIKTPIYPNRLHSLLSDDLTLALNESTVSLIEQSLELILANRQEAAETTTDRNAEVSSKIAVSWRSTGRSATDVRGIADKLQIPPAVVRHLLENAGELPRRDPSDQSTVPSETRSDAGGRGPKSSKPDWSFQDDAVRRCIQSLKAAANRKVGLVLPTGAGKTFTALRIALELLAEDPGSSRRVIWVTHRKTLYDQARKELQKMFSRRIIGLPDNAAQLFAKRIDFTMVSELEKYLGDIANPPLLVIVDEAHHAAASSYQPIFEAPYPLRGLFLTATPNRTDELPIGIDEIAFTITFRELAKCGVILIPHFEDFSVSDFDWSESSVRDLADKVIARSAENYTKVLVLAPRINRVEEFYKALQDRLADESNHPLSEEDVGFMHSNGNSLRLLDADGRMARATTEEFIDHFAQKPRAIIVSAQMLLEGFDDPDINTVVITYPSSSMVVLMQAAGRCVRYTPTKSAAFVLQARNDSLAYHFDQRWLYQEISDFLRPQLLDIDYSDLNGLRTSIDQMLSQHAVSPVVRERIVAAVGGLVAGERCRALFSGLPYYGSRTAFHQSAQWSVILETPSTSETLRTLFNAFSALGAELSDPSDFLRKQGAKYGIHSDYAEGSPWRTYTDMLTAMYFARKEVYETGSTGAHGIARPFDAEGATTWLKYITFHYRPNVPVELNEFLRDSYNRETIVGTFQENPHRYMLALKLPLPVESHEAYLLTDEQSRFFSSLLQSAREILRDTDPKCQFAAVASHVTLLQAIPIPWSIVSHIERFLSQAGEDSYTLALSTVQQHSAHNVQTESAHPQIAEA